MQQPLVSIIIPSRDEEKYLTKCLDSVLAQDYPKEKTEVLVVDGASEDNSKRIATEYSLKYPFIKVLDNPQKFTPFGLNIGIKNSRGEIIIRMDAHAGYEKDYVSKCVFHLLDSGADNVGGAMRTLPSQNTLPARAIAYSLSSPFGAASDFRVGGMNEPKSVDTVFGGCFRKEIFQKVGFFNEKLIRSQDLELNLRIKAAGGKIILFPDIKVVYHPQTTFNKFFKHNFQDGIWSIYPLKIIKMKFKLRHYLPLIFVASLSLSFIFGLFSRFFGGIFWLILFIYALASAYFSLRVSLREKDLRFLFLMPLAFACRHFGYGFGSIQGLIRLIKND